MPFPYPSYKIIATASRAETEKEVIKWINDGYELAGGPFVEANGDVRMICQAVIMTKEN